LGAPASSSPAIGIALRILWWRKPHHYPKVGIPSAGLVWCYKEDKYCMYLQNIFHWASYSSLQ
jgi:hypothetical protein